ncbi:hypothetical protein FP2506_16834 [Fulvimarina pelagi HTCC2506]|uniref:DUF4148 domain-containing protein n=1 Tax=Fulvimarina pelagi HTCC2506 TaxID=314231 RepID=Q0G2R3_9HYPH|nr:hypothetical protein [Fulvimarina pelagi]EAU42118.1 hypothetical protein FP2506_16834 [Fulvimarina pelagi HTCC2506]
MQRFILAAAAALVAVSGSVTLAEANPKIPGSEATVRALEEQARSAIARSNGLAESRDTTLSDELTFGYPARAPAKYKVLVPGSDYFRDQAEEEEREAIARGR